MIRGVFAAGGHLEPDNLKLTDLPPGQYFTSTVSERATVTTGPKPGTYWASNLPTAAYPDFTVQQWQDCMNMAPTFPVAIGGTPFTIHFSATTNMNRDGFSLCEAPVEDDECCANLELSLENDASDNQGQRAGNYEIQAENFNDRNVWKRVDGQYVLWFNNDTDYWTIGSSLGSGGGIFAPSEFDCPNDAGSQWTYYEVGSSNTFLDAGNDVSLKCQGNKQL